MCDEGTDFGTNTPYYYFTNIKNESELKDAVGTNQEGFHSSDPESVSESCHREGILFVRLDSDSHALTNLFSMYEVRIICL